MKLFTRTLAVLGASLAFVASVALLLAKAERVDPGANMIEQRLLAKRVTDLEHERDALQKEVEHWRQAAMEADAVAGEARRESFRLAQDYKGAQTEAGAALAEAKRLSGELATAHDQLARLRRKLLAMPEQAAVAPEPTPQAFEAEILQLSEAPAPVEKTVSVLNLSGDGAIAALSYGRSDGARIGQNLQLLLEGGQSAKVVLTAVHADFSVALVIGGAQAPEMMLAAGDRLPFSPID